MPEVEGSASYRCGNFLKENGFFDSLRSLRMTE